MTTIRDAAASKPRYLTGQQVRIRVAYPIGHCRTPFYVRGMVGEIERCCGAFANPEELAYGRDGLPAVPLYRVRIALQALWPDVTPDMKTAANDCVEVEIFEHWLETAT